MPINQILAARGTGQVPCISRGEKKNEEEEEVVEEGKEGKMALIRLHQPARTTSSTCTT